MLLQKVSKNTGSRALSFFSNIKKNERESGERGREGRRERESVCEREREGREGEKPKKAI